MRAGKLRHIIDIEAKTGSVSDGFGNTRPVWSVVQAAIPAEIKAASANETWVGETVQSQGAFVVTTRYMPDINSAMRIRFNGRTFNILSVSNVLERNITLTYQCKEVLPLPNAITTKTQSGHSRITIHTTQVQHGGARIA